MEKITPEKIGLQRPQTTILYTIGGGILIILGFCGGGPLSFAAGVFVWALGGLHGAICSLFDLHFYIHVTNKPATDFVLPPSDPDFPDLEEEEREAP